MARVYSCRKLSLLFFSGEESIKNLGELVMMSIMQKQLDMILESDCRQFF